MITSSEYQDGSLNIEVTLEDRVYAITIAKQDVSVLTIGLALVALGNSIVEVYTKKE